MKTIYYLIIITMLISCKKEWLEAKSDRSLVVPASINDYQLLLNNEDKMNTTSIFIGESGADNYWLSFNAWQSLRDEDKNAYVWAADIFGSNSNVDWNYNYQKIFIANLALEGLSGIKLTEVNSREWERAAGTALYFRGATFWQVAQIFAPVYNAASASTDLGIPLRKSSDINIKSERSTMQQTYDQIISDLSRAANWLPSKPDYKTHPGKIAAWCMLARTYLVMDQFEKALMYTDSVLAVSSDLLDYNSLDATADYPFAAMNAEVILQDASKFTGWFAPSVYSVDSTLYRSYENDDLRKTLFFSVDDMGMVSFKGSYNGNFYPFSGPATDEMYLIRAESKARLGNKDDAMDALNTLLETRWTSGNFVPYTAIDAEDALHQILQERRKELVFRNLRWSDLRRLNKEPQFQKTLIRELNGQLYELPPNDKRYVLPIPPDVIAATGMQQNER